MNKFKAVAALLTSTLLLSAATYPAFMSKNEQSNQEKTRFSSSNKNTIKTASTKSTPQAKRLNAQATNTATQKMPQPATQHAKNKSTSTASSKLERKLQTIHAKAKNLDKNVLRLGVKAHQNAKQNKITQKNVISIIDYSKPSTEKRFWVIDLDKEKVLFHDFVAHGKNSGAKLAKKFSNTPNSLASSIGVFLTSNSYKGKHGYAMRLDGLERGVNHNARRRAIVMHGANYVNAGIAKQLGRLGRSWGCPALPHKTNKKVIDVIKNGSLLFAYYPDKTWLNSSKFLT